MVGRLRILNQPAFVLHQRAYSETSLLLDMFTRNHGRIAVIAKGAKQKKSRTRGILLPFQPLIVAWTGRGDVKTLTGAETLLPRKLFQREVLFCGYYINELILRLLHRYDPHEALFDTYERALDLLTEEADLERILRIFEKRLLQDVGYGLQLEREPENGDEIQPAKIYRYLVDIGPIIEEAQDGVGIQVHGESLRALEKEELFTPLHRRELKQLTRAVLDLHLEGRTLNSRMVYSRLFLTQSAHMKSTPQEFVEKGGIC